MPYSNSVQVALPVPLRQLFDYHLPIATSDASVGARIRVPFAGRELIGIVMSKTASGKIDDADIKPAKELLDSSPVIPEDVIQLLRWAANYYHCPLGEAMQAALPSLLRQGEPPRYQQDSNECYWQLTAEGQGLPDAPLPKAPRQAELVLHLRKQGSCKWEELKSLGFTRDTLKRLTERNLIEPSSSPERLRPIQPPLPLNTEQQQALDRIQLGSYNTYLLDGITGSGKTEVYLQAIARSFELNPLSQTLVLVPEIGLTPQTIRRFERRFQQEIVTLHSGLTDRERLNAWVKASDGRARIIIGTRSAIFTPLRHPGLIIVDEEHDISFKQQDGFRYSARDLACLRAKNLNIPVILGSATPALESLHNAQTNRFVHLLLRQRANQQAAPAIQIVDSSLCPPDRNITDISLQAIRQHLSAGNQVLVFINRRGYAPTLQCHDCGTQVLCPNCDARLTLHQQPRHLHCHHCDYQCSVQSRCPSCNSHRLIAIGAGTERSEAFLSHELPGTDIIRIDRDSTRHKNSLESKLASIKKGAPCVLVGTQMIAKGHHFPDVTLALILDVDSGLLSADFRGPERMGQLITQVAGRAGRAEKPGEVILQTRNPDHPLLGLLVEQNYQHFATAIMTEREITQMPPFGHLAMLRADAPSAEQAQHFLQQLRMYSDSLPANPALQVLGPMPALMEKRGKRFRYLIQLKSNSRGALNSHLQHLTHYIANLKPPRHLRWSIDVDPQDMG
ncbi:primosomal protein N' [Gilvimarinus chinensis]|uniref:primosomal protein N' n=1 Tax=Gilvimarinus chinensis TaxID=396005 RepID=UPI00035C4E7E|nr:primosomal protein N' [Gilvimarinus chinensis]